MTQPLTRVVHCKRERYDIYIGRPGRWGNPFVIGPDGTREEVIEKCRKRLQSMPLLRADVVKELKRKVLGCWCKPLPCHGDVYVEICDAKEPPNA